MKKRTRYLILSLGVLVFFILAPLIIIYSSGYRFDAANNSFSKTGTIAVKTEPKTTNLFLDGKDVDQSPKNIKFVSAGSHNLTISQQDYHDWSKNLEIYPGKVTWAYWGIDKVHLILADQKPTLIANNVLAAVAKENYWLYLNETGAVRQDKEGQTLTIPLDHKMTNIIASDNGQDVIAWSETSAYYLNFKDNKKVKLAFPVTKALFFGQTPVILSNNHLSSLTGLGLVDRTYSTAASDFYILGQALYYLENQNESLFKLLVTNFGGNETLTIKKDLALVNPQLFVTPTKDIAIFSNGVVYKLNESLLPLAENISALDFSQDTGQGVLRSDHELYRLNFGGQQEIITRSADQINVATILPEIGYCIFNQGNRLFAIELDRRDKQNTYELSNLGNYKAVWEYKKGFLAVYAGDQLWQLSLY